MPTLYVTQPGSRLEREANQLAVILGVEVLLRIPAVRVTGVVLATGSGITTPALQMLLEHEVDLVLVSGSGQFLGRLNAGLDRHVELRHRQHLLVEDEAFRLPIARAIVMGKIANSRTMAMRWTADTRPPATIRGLERLRRLESQAATATSTAMLMGLEGAASRFAFAEFGRQLIEPLGFSGRRRRPPPDPVNCVLSVLSTLLHHACVTAIEAAGLDPALGFLHELRRGRASLAVDLMEEFRPLIVESVTLTLFNRRMMDDGHFRHEGTAVALTAEGWREVGTAFEQRMETLVSVPGRSTRTTYRKLLEVQAWQFRRLVEGEQDAYRPFRMR